MNAPGQNLSEQVAPALDEARIARQWAAIEAGGLPGARSPRRHLTWALPLALGAAAAVALSMLRVPAAGPSPLPEGAVVASAAVPLSVALSDGSEVVLQARSQLRVDRSAPEAVGLSLTRGEASFDVVKERSRSFAVRVDEVLVQVIGTRFTVARELDAETAFVRVSVDEGVVRVSNRADGAEQQLTAGQSTRLALGASAPKAAPAPAAVEPSEGVVEALPSVQRPRAHKGQRARPPSQPTAAAPPPPEPVPEPTAGEIFREATLARRAGRVREAAQAYGRLLTEYPEDGRAGLSAFELGRIRMDALGQPGAAVEALHKALSAGGGGFHEDALARLVVAYDTMGQHQACIKARERYLSRYPQGVHVAALSVRCGAR